MCFKKKIITAFINTDKQVFFVVVVFKLALEGFRGPAKAVTAIMGSLGLLVCRWISERLSEDSGDHGAPMMGWEVLSVALSKGI